MDERKPNRGAVRRALTLECRRAIFSPRFPIAVLLAVLWFLWNAVEETGFNYEHLVFAGVAQLLRLSISGQDSFGPVLLVLAGFPYSFSSLEEQSCGYRQQAVRRIGVRAYGASKALSVWISGFLTGAAAILVFIGVLSAMGVPHTVREYEVEGSYAELVMTMGTGWYYAAESFRVGLICGQAALFSLPVTNRIPSVYVGFLAPLVGYYLVLCVEGIVHNRVHSDLFWRIFGIDNFFFGQPLSDPLSGYIWTAAVLLAMALCFGLAFCRQLEKERAK